MSSVRAGVRPIHRPQPQVQAGCILGCASRADHVGGGPKQRTGGLFDICLCQRYRALNKINGLGRTIGRNIRSWATNRLRSKTIEKDIIPRPSRPVGPPFFRPYPPPAMLGRDDAPDRSGGALWLAGAIR